MNDQPKIPTGLAMMLKSIGIDPAEVVGAFGQFTQIMVGLDAKLNRLIEQNDQILTRLDTSRPQDADNWNRETENAAAEICPVNDG